MRGTWCEASTSYGLCEGPEPDEQVEALKEALGLVQDLGGPDPPKGAGVDI